METYQIMVTVCAGVITLITLLEKLGLTARVKKADADFNEMRKAFANITEINCLQQEFIDLQKDQNGALLAMLRNEIYQSFKINRDICAWTDDECAVQTKLHQAYEALKGNGEASIWWEKKRHWRIVSISEYQELLKKEHCK